MKIKNAMLNTPNGIFVIGMGNQGPRLGPCNVDQTPAKTCTMDFADGILTVSFPKLGAVPATTRLIPVSSVDWMEADEPKTK